MGVPAAAWDERYVPVPETGCWLWLGATTGAGYGAIKVGGRMLGAHRVSWESANRKPVPRGMMVCHKCDTPACVNPAHLFVGTARDNQRDMIRKGRALKARGESAGPSKLTADQAREIRASTESHRALARRMGVTHSSVEAIRAGRNWRWL